MTIKIFMQSVLCGSLMIGLNACKQSADVASDVQTSIGDTTMSASLASHSVHKQFACLPAEAAFVAAHRGVSKGEGYAENSGGSLKALLDRGILFAELDIAGLKDGTLILYHDGVWEEKSTGKGAVAASTWADAEKILLKDTNGKLTADRPIKFADVLALSKDKIYLEIDFKSSAKYEDVISEIRAAGMGDRVILIAYNDNQARKMARLAPEMMLSVGVSSASDIAGLEADGVKKSNMSAWLGRGPYAPETLALMARENIPILAWPGKSDVKRTAAPAALIVSDYAFDHKPIVGLSKDGRKAYEACLGK